MRLGVTFGVVCLCGLALLAVGCGGGSSGNAELRVLNASPNEGAVNVLVDSNTVASSIGYATATDYISLKTGSRHLQIESISSTTAAIDTTLSLAGSSQTTVIAANYASNIAPIILTDSITAPTSGDAQIRVVNASPSMGSVDIYIVAPGTDLTTTTPVAQSVAFESATGYTNELAGNWEIFFTAPGTTFDVLDTGPISFSAGQNRTVVSLNGPAGGYSFITLADLD